MSSKIDIIQIDMESYVSFYKSLKEAVINETNTCNKDYIEFLDAIFKKISSVVFSLESLKEYLDQNLHLIQINTNNEIIYK